MMAVRAWLETAIPPVLGKEIKQVTKADTSKTGIGFSFCGRKGLPGLPCRDTRYLHVLEPSLT